MEAFSELSQHEKFKKYFLKQWNIEQEVYDTYKKLYASFDVEKYGVIKYTLSEGNNVVTFKCMHSDKIEKKNRRRVLEINWEYSCENHYCC